MAFLDSSPGRHAWPNGDSGDKSAGLPKQRLKIPQGIHQQPGRTISVPPPKIQSPWQPGHNNGCYLTLLSRQKQLGDIRPSVTWGAKQETCRDLWQRGLAVWRRPPSASVVMNKVHVMVFVTDPQSLLRFSFSLSFSDGCF